MSQQPGDKAGRGRRARLPDQLRPQSLEYITAMDFRESPGDVLMQARLGKVFIITHQGKPIVVLSKLPGEKLALHVDPKGKVTYGL